jgi:hypothetical protein
MLSLVVASGGSGVAAGALLVGLLSSDLPFIEEPRFRTALGVLSFAFLMSVRSVWSYGTWIWPRAKSTGDRFALSALNWVCHLGIYTVSAILALMAVSEQLCGR